MFTARQYPPTQKADFLRTFPTESRAAADLLGDELTHLTFAFASVFRETGNGVIGLRIEFKTNEGAAVWVDVMGGEPRKVLDGRHIGIHSPTAAHS